MASEQAPLLEVHTGGTPEALVAGLALSLKLYIQGKPEPQQRPRVRIVTPAGKKPFPTFYEEKQCVAWQESVAFQARKQLFDIDVQGGSNIVLPAKGRMLVGLRFNMRKPVSYPKSVIHMTKKPDADNLAKGVLDGLVKGGIIEDDSMVTDLMVYKRYEQPGHPEGVEIDLTVLPD